MARTCNRIFGITDRDGDEILTEDEFSVLQTEGDGEKEGETLTQGEDERRKEFRDVIDRNHDGKADRKELLVRSCNKSEEILPTYRNIFVARFVLWACPLNFAHGCVPSYLYCIYLKLHCTDIKTCSSS